MQIEAQMGRASGFPVTNQIARLEISLHDARVRLQDAVAQGVHEDDRALLRSEVCRILEEIAKLKSAGRYRRQGA